MLQFLKASAAKTIAIRGVIVGVNFGVMLGLAALLGLELFGQLAVIWGMAMVASTVIGMGTPMMLLRHLSDGERMSVGPFVVCVLIGPATLAVLGTFIMTPLVPRVSWAVGLSASYAVHLSQCLASVMRALDSVQWSMVLRDAGPQLALGAAALATAVQPDAILIYAGFALAGLTAIAAIWSVIQPHFRGLFCRGGSTAASPFSYWSSSVLGMAMAQVDIIVGGAVLSDGQIGLYALLRRITNLVALPLSVATWVTSVPIAAAHGRGDRYALAQSANRATQIAVIPGLALACVAILAL